MDPEEEEFEEEETNSDFGLTEEVAAAMKAKRERDQELEDESVDETENDEEFRETFEADEEIFRLSQLELSDSNEEMGAKKEKKLKRVKLSSDEESSPESEGDELMDRPQTPEIPPEYWQVQRLIKYVKAGNPTATIIAMSSLRDFNLRDKYVQIAVREAGGLEVLLNMLETDENRCKIASLLVLREISSNPEISRSIYNMRVKKHSSPVFLNAVKLHAKKL